MTFFSVTLLFTLQLAIYLQLQIKSKKYIMVGTISVKKGRYIDEKTAVIKLQLGSINFHKYLNYNTKKDLIMFLNRN